MANQKANNTEQVLKSTGPAFPWLLCFSSVNDAHVPKEG
jgi:hypothetical protein